MSTVIWILLAWFVVSLVASLVLGRAMAHSEEGGE